jgi:putative DNA primase/helicase
LSKAAQDDLKDVGGYVAGTLLNGRRKAKNVTGREIITLDFDNIPGRGADDVINKIEELGCGYCVYSTRKHVPNKPRLRVLIPTDRAMTPDEYEPCARRVAAHIGIDKADPTTFEASRLMYWPSRCADGEYIFKVKDAPLMSVDMLLGLYVDWHDVSSWPQVPGTQNDYRRLAVKQGDPTTKPGIVGAFCRTYDVYRALDELLPGIYEPVDNQPDRYTYTGGSTTGGAVVYDDGKFLYSHHATDPCSGKLVNSFDLVRLHKFADRDDNADSATPVNRPPSYKAMCEFAVADQNVAALLSQERYDSAVEDFKDVEPTNDDDAANWMTKLQRHPQTGKICGTIDNIRLIFENDPRLKGRFALNKFAGRGEVLDELPWCADKKRRLWSDTDNNGLYWYMEKIFEITHRGNIDAALDVHAATHAFNDVQDYINGLEWDGVPRLDTLFIDYLGAQDTEYNRAVTRKAFAAAIARAMTPGCKYDYMLILCGPQGLGKSTIIDKMSRGWFNDSITTFEGKEASELLQGVWLVEIGELDAFRRSDVARIKQFLSLRADRYRAAYGRNVKELPRCCVFFGTCNQVDFLQDMTGNRRFWPVDVGVEPKKKSVWDDLDAEIDQIWAEAKMRWQLGEPLYLTGTVEVEAREKQEEHREASAREGMIQDFVARQIPEDWQKWPIDRRRDFWAQTAHGDIKLVDRTTITAIEVWCELFNGNIRDIRYQDAREINAVLANIPGWRRSSKILRAGPYNTQRGYEKYTVV